MTPPSGLVSTCRWLLRHPLGWLVIGLVGAGGYGVVLIVLVAVDRWRVPMPVHNAVLAGLVVAVLGPLLALLFTWLDQRNEARDARDDQRTRAWAWWLNEAARQRAAARQYWPTTPLPVVNQPEREPVPARGLTTDQIDAHMEGYMQGLADRERRRDDDDEGDLR